jgi:hypothetical protein
MNRTTLFVGLIMVVCAATTGRIAVAATAACPDSTAPNELVLVGGTPQTAQLNTPFAEPFAVSLANTNGCPVNSQVAGVPVTFSAPASGASGTFAGSGSNTVTVGAGVSGAAGTQFTANSIVGYYTVAATSQYGTVLFTLTNTASGLPYTIAGAASTSRSATVGARYAQPLSVVVRDVNGAPVAGATVTFSFVPATSGAGATFDGGAPQASVLTDATGTATSPRFSANALPGRFFAAASVPGVVEPIEFPLDNLPGKGSTLTGLLPVKQTATVGKLFASRLEVRLREADGVPVPGAAVTFAVGAAQGTAGATFAGGAAQATATTNAAGIAVSPGLVANTVAGSFTVTATAVGSRPASFALRSRTGRPAGIAAGVAAGESTTVGTRFPIRLAVTVTDRYGNAVSGARVTFIAPRSEPTARFGRRRIVGVRTDVSGVAVAPPLVAGSKAGGYVVRASVSGRTAAFALLNQPHS